MADIRMVKVTLTLSHKGFELGEFDVDCPVEVSGGNVKGADLGNLSRGWKSPVTAYATPLSDVFHHGCEAGAEAFISAYDKTVKEALNGETDQSRA